MQHVLKYSIGLMIRQCSFENLLIKSLKLVGDSEIIINVTGKLKLPEMRSDHNYISMRIPNDFNMTVKLSPAKHSYREIINDNRSFNNRIRIYNESKVDIYNIRVNLHLNLYL